MLTHLNFQQVHHYSAGGVISFGADQLIIYANPKAIAFIFEGSTFIGRPVSEFFKSTAITRPDSFESELQDEEFLMTPDGGSEKSVLISSTIYTDETGETRTYLFIRDISPLKKKENLLAYLNRATEELAQARDTVTALEQVSRLIVPTFANWFSIDLLKDGQLEELVLAHENPEMIQWARKYREAYPVDLNSNTGAGAVLKTGQPSFIPVITEQMVLSSIKNPEQLEIILKMNLQSVITVAIAHQDVITGVISFISSTSGYYFDEADLRFAQNFASHISLALENARLNDAASGEIARREQIEAELKITQGHLKSALSSGLVGTWIRDLERNLLFADESLSAMFGVPYSPEGVDPDVFQDLITPLDQEDAGRKRQQAISEAGIYETEYQVQTTDGPRWFFARGKTEDNEKGIPAFFTGVIIDITERKQAELALQKNETLFRFLADTIPHKLWTSDPDGTANYYNQGWYDYTGLNTFKELKEQIWEMLHPDDRIIAAAKWPEGIRAGRQIEMEQRFRRHDGQYRWHLTRVCPDTDEHGNIRLWVGTSTDIHEQKMIREALELSEAHFKALTQFNSLPIWQVNADRHTVFVNDTWRTFTGVTSAAISETDWTDNIHPEDCEATVEEFNTLFAKRQPMQLKYRFRHAPSDTYRWMLDNAQPVFNPDFYGYIGTMTDIHEQEQARLTIQELMSKKDEFISIASHELKTPLTSIKAFNQLQQRATDPEKALQFVRRSAEHIYRLEKLINDLLDVSRINAGKMQYDFEAFDFSRMLAETAEAFRHTAATHELILDNCDGITYTGDRFRLEQVINNLLSNAVKYSPQARQIRISCQISQDNIIVSVQDFGIGIARENLDRLFDRYYRVDNTAMRFEGLGLGLFISSEILKRHQGSLWIESEHGKGSTFYFRLPLQQQVEKPTPVKTKNHYRDEHLTITYQKDKHWLEVDWTGFQDFNSVKQGCIVMFEYLKAHQTDRIVNDNTHVQGNWSDAVDWVGHTWFPMMEQAGLKYFAHIFSPSTFSQLSAQKSIDIMAGIITTQYFTDIELAKDWIDSRPR
jgi:PAS domain S-box-containing protein